MCCVVSNLYNVVIITKFFFHLHRVQSYIKNGWAGNIINPDASSASSSSALINDNKELAFSGQWQGIQTAFQQSDQVPTFIYLWSHDNLLCE